MSLKKENERQENLQPQISELQLQLQNADFS